MAAMRPSSVALALHFDQPRLPNSDAQDLHRRPNGTVAATLRFIKFCDVVPLDAWTEDESRLKRRYVL
jgi:hypothetical protein